MAIIKNQTAGHATTRDFANVSYNVASFSVNSAYETVQTIGVVKVIWSGDWVVKQGADTIWQSVPGSSGVHELSLLPAVSYGSNSSANITATSANTSASIFMRIAKGGYNLNGV